MWLTEQASEFRPCLRTFHRCHGWGVKALYTPLDDATREALRSLAERELRPVRLQAAAIIRDRLEREGLLRPEGRREPAPAESAR